MAGGKAHEEFERARSALLNAGFSNRNALDLLTKRYELIDRFAIAALQGTLAGEAMLPPDHSEAYTNDERADWCFSMAYSMLRSRARLRARVNDNGDDE